ncbi:MAG: RNA polymerase sigma factor [Deltaproteobacteria bacterium]|nr:RNA polymerase sigma factor [Deltaproteobacteria bacterium]
MVDPELERFFRENFAVIRAKCARILGASEEAADVAQEAFVKLWESGATLSGPAARAAWIYRTCTRLAIDRLRRRRLGIETSAGEEDGGAVHAAAGLAPADELVSARQQLAALAAQATRPELEVAILCRVDGLTQSEAADVAGLSERTVRRLLDRFDARAAALGRSGP